MNKDIRFLIVAIYFLASTVVTAQDLPDSTGLPGDNFSLEAALELFKKSESPEAFERMLNEEANHVNNLDLNGDGQIDYIRVVDKMKGDAHAFVLQAVISEEEFQDIAVIETERKRNDEVNLQIIGDEDIYGEQKIVEPVEEVKTHAGTQTNKVIVNVYTWPVVTFIYGPSYRVWMSPWGWRLRPVWWNPWRPVKHHVFYHYHAPYRYRYVVVDVHRTRHAHRVYVPSRTTSVTVRTRHQEPINHYRSKTTRTTTVTTPRTTTTRKTTTVPTKDGRKVKSTKRTSRSRN